MPGKLYIKMATKLIKVDADNVAELSEIQRIHSRESLTNKRLAFVKGIAEIDELLAVLNA